MVQVFPVFTILTKEAQYNVFAELSFTGGATTTIATASASRDLGAERTVKLISGVVNGGVSVSSSMSSSTSLYIGAAAASALHNPVSAYVELRRGDNSTVVGRVSIPFSTPITFSNVRYVYVFVKAAIACDISPYGYSASGARSAATANASVFFEVV